MKRSQGSSSELLVEPLLQRALWTSSSLDPRTVFLLSQASLIVFLSLVTKSVLSYPEGVFSSGARPW